MVKSKKSTLLKDFKKTNFIRIDFFISEAKKTFIHLQETLTKILVFCYFDLECLICIETDVLGYAIGRVLNQMISDQHFSNYITYKYSIFFKAKIDQSHLLVLFS